MAALVLLTGLNGAYAQVEQFQPERLKDGSSLPAALVPLYVSDFSLAHLMDGRVYILDASNGHYAGALDAGYAGQFALSPDGRQAYIAATYLARHTHGERTDVLEIYDTSTLRLSGEVVLPKKHVQSLFTKELLRLSMDGRYLFVQNATPATSVTVVDLAQRKLLAEVSSPGCWALYPSQTTSLRFSMLCGDGSVNTITLNEDGSVASRAASRKFFDSDSAPLYINAVNDAEHYYFLSFAGKLTQVTLSAQQPVIGETLDLVPQKLQPQGWRPGGYQLMALHRASARLFIAMHRDGKEGSHKSPAQEIWEFDLHSGQLLTRRKASNAVSLSVNQGAPAYLYALDGRSNQIHAYDMLHQLRQVYVTDPVGDAPTQVDTP